MNAYEKMLEKFSEELIVNDFAELPDSLKGFYICNRKYKIVLLNEKIKSTAEKKCILAEELGHHHTTVGDILDQSIIENRKQEYKARRWAVLRLLRVEEFIDAFNIGVRNRAELAEFLEVTEEFIEMALEHFKGIYGLYHIIGDYIIYFDPLHIYKNI